MSNNFQWQTEEEVYWEEVESPTPEPKPPPRWRWLMAVMIAFLVAGASWFAYQQVERQIDRATTTMEMDLLSVHKVVRQAAQQQDVELLTTVLSGRNPRWTASQKALAAGGLLFDRSSFGLKAVATANFAAARSDHVTVTLSPDLTAAEVIWPEPFVTDVEEPVADTVTLQQTAVYRRGARSWLLAPAERDFWGGWLTSEGELLTLVYPQRDQEVAERLALDLEQTLKRVCQSSDGVFCPDDLHVHLRLENDPGSLAVAADMQAVLESGTWLELPTPTLVGYPLDEPGYEALRRGYEVHLVSAVITELVGYQCCRHGLFYRALLDKELSRLDLRPWPVAERDYEELLDGTVDLNRVDQFWDERALTVAARDVRRQVYALVDFLTEGAELATTTADLQRSLNQNVSFHSWLQQLGYDADSFEGDWLQFMATRTPSIAPPIPLPDQDIQLACSSFRGGAWLHRYNFAGRSWTQVFGREYDGDSFNYFQALPGANVYALQEHSYNVDQLQQRITVWRDGVEIPIHEQKADTTSRILLAYVAGADPSGRYLVMGAFGSLNQFQLLDLEKCDGIMGCETQALPGALLWSPDGARTVVIGAPSTTVGDMADPYLQGLTTMLYRADRWGRAPVEVGRGAVPFWIDNERYGYVRLSRTEELEVVTAVAGEDRLQVALRASDLLLAVPSAERPGRLTINGVMANPADAQQLLVWATSPAEGGRFHYAFLLRLAPDLAGVGDVSMVFRQENPGGGIFSPDGRWLSIYVWRNTYGRDLLFHLVYLQSGERQMFRSSSPGVDWSADGQWLVQPGEHYVVLRAPAYDYKQLIFHNFSGCHSARWVGEIGD
ncbi:MAG TPA: hypothetical protein VF177_16740 [Anaerolineae bacterium]